jgi:hypothetical protein
MKEPEEPELDPEMIAPYESQITTKDVTPEDFGRIAAQTAKQVILQRITALGRLTPDPGWPTARAPQPQSPDRKR